MSWSKTYDLAVKTGTYQGNGGAEKGRYENVGHILENEEGQKMIMLKRTFNPAGVPNPENRDTVILSMFEPRDRDQAPSNSQGPSPEQRAQVERTGLAAGRAPTAKPAAPQGGDPFNDDIPF